MAAKGLVIVGAGGHAKVVLSTALANAEEVCGFLDDKPILGNLYWSGFPILGDTTLLAKEDFTKAVLGLGKNSLRKSVAQVYPQVNWKALVHPAAYVHPSVQLGAGTVVFAGAVIQPDVRIGKHCIINTGATIDHDCVIGDYAHLSPGTHLAGGVRLGEGALLGIGSAVIQEVDIGDWVIVGAGGVVINNIPAQKTVVGVPAKERV